MNRVHVLPLGCHFIAGLSRFLESLGTDLKETAVVFPGKRPALYLKAHLAGSRGVPFFPPRCFSMDEFADYLLLKLEPRARQASSLDLLWLLYESVRDLGADGIKGFNVGHFGDFYPWGGHLLRFLNQIDIEHVADESLLSVEENAAIGYDVPPDINDLLGRVVAIRRSFHERLTKRSLLSPGLRYRRAVDGLGALSLDEYRRIVFAGFFALTGCERRIVSTLLARGEASMVIEGDPGDWTILTRLLASLDASPEHFPSPEREPAAVRLYAGFDTHSQILKAAAVLDGNGEGQTAVVLPKPESLIPLLTFAADRAGLPYNISLPFPMARTPLFELVTSVLEAQQAVRSGTLYPASSYLAVLLHPFVKNMDITAEFRGLALGIEARLSGRERGGALAGRPFVRPDEVEREVERAADKGGTQEAERVEALRSVHRIFFGGFEGAATVGDMALALEEMLSFVLAHTRVRSYILAGETFRRLFELLGELRNSLSATGRFHDNDGENRRGLCDFVLRYLEQTDLPFSTTPLEPLEILGVLETRSLTFDRVIILDLNEGVIPGPKKIDPLVPLGIYEKLGLPTTEEQEEMYRYYFTRLLRSAREIHLICSEAADTPRSRYIEQLLWREEKAAGRLGVLEVERSAHAITFRPPTGLPSAPKSPGVLERLTKEPFSPSAIDDYLRCPLVFYYRRVLDLEPKRKVRDEIEDMDRGLLVHRILFEAFSGFTGRTITPDAHAALEARLTEAIAAAFGPTDVTGEYHLFRRMTEFKLHSFLARHLRGAPAGFIIEALEHPVSGRLKVGGGDVTFRGRIDRIDRCPDTGLRTIIDYKTGGGKQYPKRLFLADPASMDEVRRAAVSLQLPLYVHLLGRPGEAGAPGADAKLILLKTNTEEGLYDGRGGLTTEAAQTRLMAMVETTIAHLLDPTHPFAPFDDALCGRCDYRDLCHT